MGLGLSTCFVTGHGMGGDVQMIHAVTVDSTCRGIIGSYPQLIHVVSDR